MAPLVWLVTGCSSGLGLEFVHSILARGDKIIATARNTAKISALTDMGAHVLELDVTADQEHLDGVMKEALAVYNHIDVLVNNAGYTELGTLEDVPHERWVAQFETNVFGAINVTRSLLPHFRSRKAGVVVFIGSLSGWRGDPVAGVYASSKFALEGVVESFQAETAPLGIKSVIVEPGMFRTELLSSENGKFVDTKFGDYKEIHNAVVQGARAFSGKQQGDPQKAVEIIIDVVKQEGKATGKGIPSKLPLGADAVSTIRKKCTDTLKLLDEWAAISSSTDFPEGT